MKTKLLFAIVAMATTFTFSGCLKKGEDDPMISFKSRKARVVGEWKLTAIKRTSTYSSGTINSTSVMTGDGSTYTSTYTVVDSTTTRTGTLSWDWTLRKDGTYKYTYTEDGNITTSAGTWNFASGVGDLKNKSQITYYQQSYTNSGSTSTWTGNYVDDAYDIKELRNKKMVWYEKTTSSSTGSNSSYETEMTFKAK